MLLSKEYVSYLAREVTKKLIAGEFIETKTVPAVAERVHSSMLEEFGIEDRNTIRLEVRKILEELLNQEERIDQSARVKIESQKRTILEGSQEWDILYRKYYNEEVKKLGM